MERTMQHSLAIHGILALLGLASIASPSHAGGVRNFDQPALGTFQEIRAAAAAAADGDTLIVGAGTYTGFTLDGKALSIFGAPGEVISIDRTVEVKNLSSAQTVVLSGLEITGTSVYPTSKPALLVSNVAGFVRVQHCALTGGVGSGFSFYPGGNGGIGASIASSPRVSFASCIVRGGAGYGGMSGGGDAQGGEGGVGLLATGSKVSVHGGSVSGGDGGSAYDYGGNGGRGVEITSSTLFASGSPVRGGDGGDAFDYWFGSYAGNGGDGLRLDDAAAHAELLGTSTVAGLGGHASSEGTDGFDGQSVSGSGTSHVIPGTVRGLSVGRDVLSDHANLTITVKGSPGDAVYFASATRAGFLSLPSVIGPWLVHFPVPIAVDPAGVVPPSGVLALSLPVPDLASPSLARRIDHLQALCVGAGGERVLTGAVSIAVLNPSFPPDCNANGVYDVLETITATSSDCDHNLQPDTCDPDCDGNGVCDGCEILTGAQHDCNGNQVPDNCEIAAGTAFDCNQNGFLDECDLAAGTSVDANHNGIPDECESASTWYVDASALPGGNGSSSNPFQALASAFDLAIDGDVILVRDGTYVGAGNRNLDFLTRNLVVRSVNGPSNCVIDLQGQGRAFELFGAQTFASMIEGFTIKNGSPTDGHGNGGGGISTFGATYSEYALGVTIRDCVFDHCQGATGGALKISVGARIQGCVFRDSSANFGGAANFAVSLSSQLPEISIVGCTFEHNNAAWGGAIHGESGAALRISHSKFLGNVATYGGAIHSMFAYYTVPGGAVTVDDSLFAGNSAAQQGGAIMMHAYGISKARVTNSTFSANSALNGGAIFLASGADVTVLNSILWGDTATTGHELASEGTGYGAQKLTVAWSNVQGGLAAVSHPVGQVTWGAGNLDLDPAFADPDGPDNDPATLGDNDYRLTLASPCIDAADNGSIPPDSNDIDGDADVTEPTPLDLDLRPRRVDVASVPDTGSGVAPIVDMGAYEHR
jgi:predicted outer membrane repeat protein